MNTRVRFYREHLPLSARGLLIQVPLLVSTTELIQDIEMLNAAICSGSRCPKPQFPSILFSFPPSFANGRELGDTGCRGQNGMEANVLDFVTEPMDTRGSDRSFRC